MSAGSRDPALRRTWNQDLPPDRGGKRPETEQVWLAISNSRRAPREGQDEHEAEANPLHT
jgi:hypothetical protein